MKEFRKLLPFAHGYKFIYALAMIAIIFSQLFNTFSPLIIKTTIDSIIGSEVIESDVIQSMVNFFGGSAYLVNNLWVLGILFVLNTGFRGLFLYFKNILASKSAENIVRRIRNKLYDNIQRLPYKEHIKLETGELLQRCTSDVETIRRFLDIQFVELGGSIFMLFFIFAIMLNLNLKMVLVSFALVPIIFSFALVFFKRVQREFEEADKSEASLSTSLQENLTGVRVVKAFAREDYEIDKFDIKNTDYRSKVNKLIESLALYWSVSDFFSISQTAIVIIFGTYYVVNGEISIGTMVAFISYIHMMIWPIRQMGRTLTDMGKATVSIKRIQEVLDKPIERLLVSGEQPEIKGNIELENVSFSYEKDHEVLKDISFKVNAGETAAIIGATGSGKSTLVHLLPRLYDYDKGSIKFDGIELNTIDKRWIRKKVGLILQESFLYAKTIRDNIRLTDPQMGESRIIGAAKLASIHDDIDSFDRKYDTMVGERGVSLSGGQKQRMAIARTIINECPIIIFDDSLSAVDTETDKSIREALAAKGDKVTTIIISHRISTVSQADKIIVLDKGRIAQIGSHEDLMKEEGLYRRLYDMQSSIDESLV